MSDTPRTDKALKRVSGLCRSANYANGITKFARELERELNAAKAELAELKKALNNL